MLPAPRGLTFDGHRFTFALENEQSPEYFTEKRFQASPQFVSAWRGTTFWGTALTCFLVPAQAHGDSATRPRCFPKATPSLRLLVSLSHSLLPFSLQALLGGSVPVVFGNDGSMEYLPGDDAALVVGVHGRGPDGLSRTIRRLADEPEEFARFFAWKRRGIRRSFAKALFLSRDYLACRLCEHVAHTYPRPSA